MADRPRCGQALTEMFGEAHTVPSTVYLKTTNGPDTALLPYDSAAALLKQVTASPVIEVAGDLASGFAWAVPGAYPRRSYAVVPVPAPVWPNTPHPTAVTIELWWPPDHHGRRHIRSFVAQADEPFNAYLMACCLWSTKATGAGAEAAFLYGPDRRVAYRISAAAWTCSRFSAQDITRVVATAADRDTTDPLPDTPRTSAMREERIDGVLTYTGTSTEIAECLTTHAASREASMDVSAAFNMRKAAEEIENGSRTEFQNTARYRVADAPDSEKARV